MAESIIMEITKHRTREIFDAYKTISADDARNTMERFQVYLDRNGSPYVTQSVPQQAKKG